MLSQVGLPRRKILSLISLIPKWSGTEKSVSVKEFFESVESSALIGNWSQFAKVKITVLKLTEVAKAFYNSKPQLHSTSISRENCKDKFFTNLEVLEMTSITLRIFRQPGNRKMKFLQVSFTCYESNL